MKQCQEYVIEYY